jgi:mono/diheme cytochrome c family protein
MNMKKTLRLSFARGLALLLLSVSIISCGGEKKDSDEAAESETTEKSEVASSDTPAPYKADNANLDKGKTIYLTNCAPCHGKVGKGDGPAAANLNPKPRDHSKGEYMSKLTDDHIGRVVKLGGGIAGFPGMPAHPQFKTEDVNAVIAYMRTLSQGK